MSDTYLIESGDLRTAARDLTGHTGGFTLWVRPSLIGGELCSVDVYADDEYNFDERGYSASGIIAPGADESDCFDAVQLAWEAIADTAADCGDVAICRSDAKFRKW